MKKPVKSLGVIVALWYPIFITSLAYSQDNSLQVHPGYVHFANLAEEYGEAKVEINLSETMLGFVGSMSKNDDPQLAELISKLKGVRVLVFNTGGNLEPALAEVSRVSKKLQKNSWNAVVSVREENEQVRIFTKITKGIMDGLVLMVADSSSDETVFINILGVIDPSQIGQVAKSLNFEMGI